MDDETRVGMFGGVAGRLVRDATSPGTAFTGFVLGVILLAAGFVCRMVEADAVGQLFGQIVMAVALARFALNGYAGEYRGTILSTTGGTWPQALMVAGRYLTLQLIWMVPVALLGWSAFASIMSPQHNTVALTPFSGGPMAAPATEGPGPAAFLPILAILTSKAFLWSIGLMFFGMLFLPPVSLIMAVRSERFGDLFNGGLWRATFGGRIGDLYTLYAMQAGGVGMGLLLMLPFVLLGYAAGSEIGILFLVIALGFVTGLGVTLLGRLCGFFAFGDESPAPALGRAPEPPSSRAPSPAEGPKEAPSADAAGEGNAGSRLPPLLDGVERAAAARERFKTDRDGAIAELEGLRDAHAPNPQILHGLALLLRGADRDSEALPAARTAIGLCLQRGHAALAAELFAAFWKQANRLELSGDQIDAVAGVFLKGGDLGQATAAFGLALNLDHGDRKAIKGLLQIADQRLHRESRPKDAARIYTFLLQYASASPFADDMRRGLAEAESRLARAS